jgi:hypothetical protein
MKYNLIATLCVQQEIEANSEEEAKQILKRHLGLFETNPFDIQLAEEVEFSTPQSEQLEESNEPT